MYNVIEYDKHINEGTGFKFHTSDLVEIERKVLPFNEEKVMFKIYAPEGEYTIQNHDDLQSFISEAKGL